jgi:hypothetical protein
VGFGSSATFQRGGRDLAFLILDAWLMVVAWRKGWRWRAFLPLGVMMSVAFLMGLAIAAGGGDVRQAAPLTLVLEFAALGVLIWIATRVPMSVPALGVHAHSVTTPVTAPRSDC